MKPSHELLRPRLVCEMFTELQARALGKDHPATVTDRDIQTIEDLMSDGVSFVELKNALRWLFLTPQGIGYWGTKIGQVREFVNAYDTIAVRVDKHFDRPPVLVSGGDAVAPRPGVGQANHIRQQADTDSVDEFYRLTGEPRPDEATAADGVVGPEVAWEVLNQVAADDESGTG